MFLFRKAAIAPIILCFQLVISSVFAAECYVSPAGDDSDPGSEARPWKTIQKAADTLVAGDTVWIMEGTYREQVIARNSGAPDAWITYSNYRGQTVTIDGTGLELDGWGLFQISAKKYIMVTGLRIFNSPGYGLGEENSSYITFENNYIYNTVNSGIIAGEWSGRNDHIVIRDNEVELACNDGPQECISVARTDVFEVTGNHVHHGGPGSHGGEGIDVKFGSNTGVIENNHVHHMNRQGIYVDAWTEHTYDIRVFNNICHDNNNQDGFDCCSEQGGLLENIYFYNNIAYNNKANGFRFAGWGNGPMKNIQVINNTFVGNGGADWGHRGGILVDNGNVEGIIIRNNICVGNEEFEIALNPDVKPGTVTIDHNLIFSFKGFDGETRGDNVIEADPLFVNAAEGDYRLKPGSPALDSGSAVDAPADDIMGARRPQGGGVDIGAYEMQ